MGEDGDRAGGLAERALIVLEGQAVEPEAEIGSQVGVAAADLGDAVRVLDDPDRFATGVAVDDAPRGPRSGPPAPRGALRSSPGRRRRPRPSRGREPARRERRRAPPRPRRLRAGRAAGRGAESGGGGSTSSSVSAPSGSQTSRPSTSTSAGSSHSSPPSSSMSLSCGRRPRFPGADRGSRRPPRRKFSSSAAKAKNGSQSGIQSFRPGRKTHARIRTTAKIRRRRANEKGLSSIPAA